MEIHLDDPVLKDLVRRHAQKMLDMSEEERELFLESLIYLYENKDNHDVEKIMQRDPAYEHVDLVTFVEDTDFLGMKGEIYPKVWPELLEINSGHYDEAVLTGSIGCAKTSIALLTQAWSLFQLSRYPNPQALYGLQKSSEIVFIFQNISATLAKVVDYGRFKEMIDNCTYFKEVFPYDRDLKTSLKFPNRIEVKPVSGTATAAIGQNVFAGMIDEVNYMDVIERSSQAVDGGVYNQADSLYNAIARRRKSRFLMSGQGLPGVLCLVSSKRYPGEFTEQKKEERENDIRVNGFSRIYYYDKRSWEILPEDRFSKETFKVFIGDESRQPRIMEEEEKVKKNDKELVLYVPVDYKNEFNKDLTEALREIGGISVLSHFPFLHNRELVFSGFDNDKKSILTADSANFDDKPLGFYKKFQDQRWPRWVHVDLGLTSDSAGVVCGYVSHFKLLNMGDYFGYMPYIKIDFMLEVTPIRNGEVQFNKIRDLVVKLRKNGLPIMWVTYDTWQSADSLQMLAKEGFSTGLVSLDKSPTAYDFLKSALYEKRLEAPMHTKGYKELISLERDKETMKIDHPPNGSKDISDALAAVVYRLTISRRIWAEHNVPMYKAPQDVLRISENSTLKYDQEEQKEGDAIRRTDKYFLRKNNV